MSVYAVELEHGVFIAKWEGDPGRTLDIRNAKIFDTKREAELAIADALTYRPFKKPEVLTLSRIPQTAIEASIIRSR